MSSILQVDDLELGMFITVHTGRTKITRHNNSPSLTETITLEDRSFKGRVLELVAVNLPYIIVKRHKENFSALKKSNFSYRTIDTREVKLIKLTKEYIKILFPEIIK